MVMETDCVFYLLLNTDIMQIVLGFTAMRMTNTAMYGTLRRTGILLVLFLEHYFLKKRASGRVMLATVSDLRPSPSPSPNTDIRTRAITTALVYIARQQQSATFM